MDTFTDRSITSCNIDIDNGMRPTRANSFWIQVTNNLGYSIEGDRTDSEIIDDPTIVLHQAVVEGDSVILSWSKSTAIGPETYEIFESTTADIWTGGTRNWTEADTTLRIPLYEYASGNETWYYQVKVYAPYDQEGWINQIAIYYDACVEGHVNIWGHCYNIEETTSIHRCESCWPWQEPHPRGPIPTAIGELVNLTDLIVEHSPLDGPIPPEIGNLTNLTHLEFSNTTLTGSIPSEIGSLTNLTHLDLEVNQLTGSIPSEIGNLTNLTRLFLNNNQLTGPIPPEIGNLTNLYALHLINNQLSGEIPDNICNLNISWSNDYDFSIESNQLCPPYPSCVVGHVGEQDTTNCD